MDNGSIAVRSLSLLQSFYIHRVRFAARWLLRLARLPGGARALIRLRALPGGTWLLRYLVGYRRPFDSYDAAETAIKGLANGGHTNPLIASVHINITATLRPSDYAALYHLRPLVAGIRRIFDVGGSIGTLYYAYSAYLALPDDLVWQVFDLPTVVCAGRTMARERLAQQLRFTADWSEANGSELLIASGSAHYLRTPLPEMIARLERPPAYVLLNRTPLREGETVATTQDGLVRLACILYDIDSMIRGFEAAGYQLVDQWKATEVSLHIPGFPDYSLPHYTGMFLRRKAIPDVSAG